MTDQFLDGTEMLGETSWLPSPVLAQLKFHILVNSAVADGNTLLDNAR